MPNAKKPTPKKTTSTGKKPATKTSTAKKAPAKKRTSRKKGHGKMILTILMVILILVAAGFIYYLGKTAYTIYKEGADNEGSGETVDPVTYETTPVAQSEKVGYYVLGLMGADGNEGEMEMLSIVCFDKKEKTARILQIPQDTYLGTDGTFKVKKVSEVFANPQDNDWCDTCRGRVFAPEKAEDNTHTVCGTELTKKQGSSTVNLVEVFNQQYGLPVDGYYIFEQETFVKLVDLVDGVDVELAFDVTVDDTTYQKGVRTIDGAAALKYVMAKDDKLTSDIDRFARFQQVFTAVFQRLFRMSENELVGDVFQPLMMGSTPLRIAVGDNYKNIAALVMQASQVSFEDMTAYVIPGESATSEGVTYYSVHRQELLALLNAQFNPHSDPLTEGDLGVSELASGKTAELHETKLSQWAIEQSGASVTTDETETTTTAAS